MALNLLGARLAVFWKLPLFLDTPGTILAAVLGGYLPGVAVGFFSNAVISIGDPISLYYGILNVGIAFCAAYLGRRGAFRRLWTSLCCALSFACIGGVLGSLMTWGLYGLNIGEGISAPLALLLHRSTRLGAFCSQLLADCGIDLLDKTVTVLLVFSLLRALPRRALRRLPLGALYLRRRAAASPPGLEGGRFYKTFSLGNKVATIIVITAVVLSGLGAGISFFLYKNTMDRRYIQLGTAAVNLAANELDGDAVNAFLRQGTPTPAYRAVERRLEAVRAAMADVRFLYVYRIAPDGCHVVFDLDSPGVPADKLGDIVDFDPSFAGHLPALFRGGDIPPVVSNDKYGWLLTVYKPIFDSAGACAAYVAVDIAMDAVMSDRYAFLIRIVALLFGVSILIVSFSFWYAQHRLVIPINSLATATSNFAYDSEHNRRRSQRRIQALDIRTGDEIENLYDAIGKTTADLSRFVQLLHEQSEDVRRKSDIIARMQSNVILSFANMVEFRDGNTGSHIRHTAAYVDALARALRRRGLHAEALTDDYLEKIRVSAPLHDMGKIRISDAILNKPGRLTDEEFEIMKYHAVAGGEILRDALHGIEGDNYLSVAILMATHHHERWDGKGYPQGLSGEDIPLCARIMAVADVFDALITRRSYKDTFSFEKAMGIIREEAGTHFDPVIAAVFLDIAEEIRALTARVE